MRIAILREIKADEFRVSALPGSVRALRRAGHAVWVERGAGEGCGHPDAEYAAAGATLCDAATAWAEAELAYKVKEPQPSEYGHLRPGLTLFTYFHLAANRSLAEAVLKSGVNALAFESIRDREGRLPCLVPMSEVAGRMSVQEGAKCLEKVSNGRGVLLAGVPGVRPAEVVVVGGGVVGSNAARMAAGLGARVTVLDVSLPRLRYLAETLPANCVTVFASHENLAAALAGADLAVGAVLREGAPTPKVITADMVRGMKPGSALVDVSIDQGGCSETSRVTTHSHPTYVEFGVVHYCVGNMPGGVARTSTEALGNATLPYALSLANLGPRRALAADP
ncbi:MAG TPA: alanine dehydrogenase, partial [bacterium]|nr:alanine dehydrogenase [bacterium]